LKTTHVSTTRYISSTIRIQFGIADNYIYIKQILPVLSWNRLIVRKDPVLFWHLWIKYIYFISCHLHWQVSCHLHGDFCLHILNLRKYMSYNFYWHKINIIKNTVCLFLINTCHLNTCWWSSSGSRQVKTWIHIWFTTHR
jgi:hypothetical protein